MSVKVILEMFNAGGNIGIANGLVPLNQIRRQQVKAS